MGPFLEFLAAILPFSPFLANFPVPDFEKREADQPKTAPGKKQGNSEHTNFELSWGLTGTRMVKLHFIATNVSL